MNITRSRSKMFLTVMDLRNGVPRSPRVLAWNAYRSWAPQLWWILTPRLVPTSRVFVWNVWIWLRVTISTKIIGSMICRRNGQKDGHDKAQGDQNGSLFGSSWKIDTFGWAVWVDSARCSVGSWNSQVYIHRVGLVSDLPMLTLNMKNEARMQLNNSSINRVTCSIYFSLIL